ncbi:MAG: PAS domain-containing protein, partial [Anaerolineae bacterium]|nr:PAS domain-containing protein [Anaerolineae bacterium]
MPVVRKTSDITAIPIETQFQAILDSLAAHVAVLDKTGVIVTINKAWEDFARANGVNSVAEVGVGVNYLEVCQRAVEHASPEAHQALVGLQAVLAGSPDTYTVEYPCHSPAEKRWFIVNISPMPPEYGGAVVAHFNITERRVAEDSLRTNQAILKAIVEGTTDPMFIKDRQGKYLLINAAGAQVIGKPIEEIIGKRDKAVLPADFAQEVIEDDQRVITTGQAHKFENTVKTGQTTRHFHSLKTPYRNDKGEIVGIIGISRDITELKQVERYNRLLAEAGKVLSSSLDYRSRLSKVAQLAVPDLADWCSVDVLQENEEVHHVVVAHVDPAKVALAHSLQERYPPDWEAPTGAPNVLRTGQSELYPDISDDLLVAAARDEEHLAILRELQMKSAMVVPLVARGRAVGVMTFVWAESNRHYTERDLILGEELARRAAISMDNARLYEAERRSRRAAEQAFRHIADLQAVTAALSEALTPLQVGKALIEEGLKTIEANSSLIVLLTPEGETLKILTSVGYPAEQTKGWKTFPLSAPVPLAECVRTGEPIFISSYEELKARYPTLGKQQTEYNGALASIPLISDAKPIGAIGLSFAAATDFTPDLRNFLLSLARQGSQAFERARLFTAERFARRAAERANRRIANLQTITASLSEALTPLEIAKAITKKELAIIGAESG